LSRLNRLPPETAEARCGEHFIQLRHSYGRLPQAYLDLGAASPLALAATLQLDQVLRASRLDTRAVEAIKLALSEAAGCDYCLAVHVLVGRRVGLDAASIAALRAGTPSGDAALDAMASFARRLLATRGHVPASEVTLLRNAGYDDAQIAESLLVIGSIVITNLFNRVNDTAVDLPPAPALAR